MPGRRREQAADHAGTLDDELALLVVHGVLHVLGHDHAETGETAVMRARELELLRPITGAGPAPAGSRQDHVEDGHELAGPTSWMLVAIFAHPLRARVPRHRRDRAQPHLAGEGPGDRRLARARRRRRRCIASSPIRSGSSTRCSSRSRCSRLGQAFLTTLVADSLFGAAGVAVGFVLNVIVFFVLAEAMPKTWAVLSAERAALFTARPIEWLVSFPPLRLISRALIGLTNVLLPGKGLKEGPFVSEQELLGIVGAAADDEVIEHEERELIESIIEFGDTVAREVMVPRPDMLIVENDSTVTAALDMAIANGVSRLPVHGGDGEDIVGLAYTKDLIRAEREGRGDEPVLDLARPVHFIPENKPVSRLMREMQKGKFHLAIVADEYGGIAGLITLEDCLEELVGEIVDEYDVETDDGPAAAQRRLPRRRRHAGRGPERAARPEAADEDWDTVGGFIFGTLEHVPEIGESVLHDGWRFTVEELDGRRIRTRADPLRS